MMRKGTAGAEPMNNKKRRDVVLEWSSKCVVCIVLKQASFHNCKLMQWNYFCDQLMDGTVVYNEVLVAGLNAIHT